MPCSSANTILARVRGQAKALLPHIAEESTVALLDSPIAPKKPIRVGDRVRIFSLIPCEHLFPDMEDERPRYIARNSGIEGTVTGVRPAEKNIVELVVRNENERSTITHACVTIAQVHGVTTQLSLILRIFLWLATLFTSAIRDIPLQPDAIVYNDGPRNRSPAEIR
ncbi:hypothetical protein ACG7TL_008408 [Trametes sanguinea]